MTEIIDKMGQVLQENYLTGLAFALFAGLITVFSPCALSNVSLIVTYVSGLNAGKKKAFLYSLFICLGQMTTFITLGVVAAAFGKLMTGSEILDKIWHIILAFIMLFMALELLGITKVLTKLRGSNLMTKVSKKGFLGAYLLGITGGICCLPCSTPILAAILAYIASTGAEIWQGALLLLVYSVGHSVLLVIAGTSIGLVNQMANSDRFNKAYKVIRSVFGVIVLIIGAFLVFDAF